MSKRRPESSSPSPPPQEAPTNGSSTLSKRARTHNDLVVSSHTSSDLVHSSSSRTSGLMSPIVRLDGHWAEVLDIAFDPSGQHIATASKDKSICLWNVYGDCQNFGVLRGPTSKSVPLALKFSSSSYNTNTSTPSPVLIASFSCGSLVTYCVKTGEILRRHRGANGPLNSIDVNNSNNNNINNTHSTSNNNSSPLILSGGDDGFVRVWDIEQREPIEEIELGYPITAVTWSVDGQQVFASGLDNDIHVYDLRAKKIAYSLRGHSDTPTSLSLSPLGSHLLSIGNDSTARIWDVRPFAPTSSSTNPNQNPRLYRTLLGAPAGYEGWLRRGAWDASGSRVVVGGADRTVNVYDVETSQLLYKLPGHTGTVIATAFHPSKTEPVVASGGVDRTIYLGELIQA